MFTQNTFNATYSRLNVIYVNMKKNTEKTTYHHGDLKKALMEASLKLLKEEGYQALSLRKVAKLAGVSQSAPYRHYPDLESLLAEIATEGFKLLAEQLKKLRTQFPNRSLLQFRESGIRYVEFALKNPDLFKIMYGNQIQDHSKYDTLIAAEEETFDVLVNIISDCKKDGLLATNDVKKTSIAAWTMVHGIAVLLSGKQMMFRKIDFKNAKTITKEMIEHLYLGMKP